MTFVCSERTSFSYSCLKHEQRHMQKREGVCSTAELASFLRKHAARIPLCATPSCARVADTAPMHAWSL
jgi:hypothetical protein